MSHTVSLGKSGARCHYTLSDLLLLPILGCTVAVLRLPVISERQHAIPAPPQGPRRTSSRSHTKPAWRHMRTRAVHPFVELSGAHDVRRSTGESLCT